MPKPNTSRKRGRSPAKKIRDQQIVLGAMEGKNATELANEFDLCRQQVTLILSRSEIQAIVKQGESDLAGLVSDAVNILRQAVKGTPVDLGNSLKAALAILKTHGVVKEKSEIEVKMPKPTVIQRRDGSQVVLGVESEDE